MKADVEEASDEQLVQAVARGDLEAFNELVKRYEQRAWNTAYRFLGDAMEAEDVAQQSFLRVFAAARRYRPTAAFRVYFYRILIRLCIDRTRRKPLTSIDNIPEIPDPYPNPAQNLLEKERRALIRDALDTLPHNQRAAMILRHYEGLRYVEIAQTLGVTPKAVERLISRAVASLQIRLSHLHKNESN